MIKTVVFDMGNVLIYFNRYMFMDRAGVEGEDRDLISDAVFSAPAWPKLDAGELDEPEAYEEAKAMLPERLHAVAKEMIFAWDDPVIPVPGMAELVQELKKNGYRILLLSNASRRQHEYWPRIPGADLFDGTLISGDIRMVKPDPAIYRTLYSKFSLNPAECVFIDDAPQNVSGAEATGMQAILFEDNVDSLREKLREKGVRVS